MKRKLTSLLKIVFSGALLYWLFQKLDWIFVLKEIGNVNIGYIVVFVVLQLCAMALSAKKWQAIARFQNINFSLWAGLKIYLVGTFINNFLPSTIGGDIYRSLWLVKRGNGNSQAFSTVLFDRLTGLSTTLILTLLMAYFVIQEVMPVPHFLWLSYLLVLGALGAFIGIVFFIPQKFVHAIPWVKLRSLCVETVRYRSSQVWGEATLWGSAFVVVGLGISNYVLFLALGYTLPFFAFFGLVFLMALYVSLPISINNIGVKEWAYGVLFVLLGVSFETAVTVAILSRVLQTGISLLGLPIYLKESLQRKGGE